jgi:hypothetical protein
VYSASPEQEVEGAPIEQIEGDIKEGTLIVLRHTPAGLRPRNITATVEEVFRERGGFSYQTSSEGGIRGTLTFKSKGRIWNLKQPGDEVIQEHHKIPWEYARHINHPLRRLSQINLREDRRNLVLLEGHLGSHWSHYHDEVDSLMWRAYSSVRNWDAMAPKERQQRADEQMQSVMEEIERRIGSGALKLYSNAPVRIFR